MLRHRQPVRTRGLTARRRARLPPGSALRCAPGLGQQHLQPALAGRDADRYAGPWRTATANPVLVLDNRYDAQTPLEDATAVSYPLTNSRLLGYDGVGHVTYRAHDSACIDDAVHAYLHGTVPTVGGRGLQVGPGITTPMWTTPGPCIVAAGVSRQRPGPRPRGSLNRCRLASRSFW